MRQQVIYGKPRRCPNRQCRAPFYRDCHQGYHVASPTEVYAVMNCKKCGDLFAILQIMSMAHEYSQQLPLRPSVESVVVPITKTEITKMRKSLEEPNILQKLYEGRPKPGMPGYSMDEESR